MFGDFCVLACAMYCETQLWIGKTTSTPDSNMLDGPKSPLVVCIFSLKYHWNALGDYVQAFSFSTRHLCWMYYVIRHVWTSPPDRVGMFTKMHAARSVADHFHGEWLNKVLNIGQPNWSQWCCVNPWFLTNPMYTCEVLMWYCDFNFQYPWSHHSLF